jgi:hypothetical protein
VAEQAIELDLVVLMSEEAAAVHVEVTGRDRRLLPLESGELTNGVLGDSGHCTSRGSGS